MTSQADRFGNVVHILLDLHESKLQWIQVITLLIKKGVEPKSLETKRAVKNVSCDIPGSDNGKQIWKKIRASLAPSIRADSRMASGMVLEEKERIDDILNGERSIGTIKPNSVTKLKYTGHHDITWYQTRALNNILRNEDGKKSMRYLGCP